MSTSSHLRKQSTFSPLSAHSTAASYSHPTATTPTQTPRKMSVTQTYRLAHTARGKLSHEASRGEHNLRLLVGHANLLDSLMLDLQEAEREQEAWYEENVKASAADKHVVWQDETVVDGGELIFPDGSDSTSDSDSDSDDFYDDEEPVTMIPLKRSISTAPAKSASVLLTGTDDEEDEYADDDESNSDLLLTRTSSHIDLHRSTASRSPPELIHDSDESDDDTPASPPHTMLQFDLQSTQPPRKTESRAAEEALFEDGFYIPEHSASTMIAAY